MEIVDGQKFNSFKEIFSCIEHISAFVSQYPNSSQGNIIFYGKFLNTCSAIVSVFVFLADFTDEINTLQVYELV